MFEDELIAFLISKVADGTFVKADLTGVSEESLTGEALVITYNATTLQSKEKTIFLYKDGVNILYYTLKKSDEPIDPITVKQKDPLTVSSTTPELINGLSFDVIDKQKYHFMFMGEYQSSELTTGVGFTFTAPDANKVFWSLTIQNTKSGTQQTVSDTASSLTAAKSSTSVAAINTDYMWKIEGYFSSNADGTLQLCAKSEVEGSAVTISNTGLGILTPIG